MNQIYQSAGLVHYFPVDTYIGDLLASGQVHPKNIHARHRSIDLFDGSSFDAVCTQVTYSGNGSESELQNA